MANRANVLQQIEELSAKDVTLSAGATICLTESALQPSRASGDAED
jgi:hypothetical protein